MEKKMIIENISKLKNKQKKPKKLYSSKDTSLNMITWDFSTDILLGLLTPN